MFYQIQIALLSSTIRLFRYGRGYRALVRDPNFNTYDEEKMEEDRTYKHEGDEDGLEEDENDEFDADRYEKEWN